MDFFIDLGMATGPVLGYIHQYFLIKVEKSVGTFSIDICGILLFANILRLNFYIFNQYQLALFFQSLIMISAQIFLVHICTKYANNRPQVKLEPVQSSNLHHEYQPQKKENIWRWKSFSSYFIFIAGFAFSTFSLSIIFKQLEFQAYGVFVGLVALLSQVGSILITKSMLILPQIIQNYLRQSTKGLSRPLVVLNLSGDIFKLIYFLMKSQAFQFVLCGIIQVILDSFVVVQIFYYRRLEEEKFGKENKSLVLEKKKSAHQEKPQSETKLEEVQMKHMEQISPQPEDSMVLETSYQEGSARISNEVYQSTLGPEETDREVEFQDEMNQESLQQEIGQQQQVEGQ